MLSSMVSASARKIAICRKGGTAGLPFGQQLVRDGQVVMLAELLQQGGVAVAGLDEHASRFLGPAGAAADL